MRIRYLKFLKIIVAFLLTTVSLYGGERGWNSPELAEAYHHHSEMQRSWAMELLNTFSFEGMEHVLDFGCGDGKITAQISQLVPNGSVTGFDISPDMIQLAKTLFPVASYNNLSFCDTHLSGEYDLICSFSVLHFVDDPVAILANLKSHLKPTGRLLLIIPEAPDASRRLVANEILQKYGIEQPWKNRPAYTSEISIRTLKGCTIKLQEAGYEILSIERADTPFLFKNLEAYIDWLIGTASANWGIPFSMSRQIFTEYANRLLELEPQLMDDAGCVSELTPRIQVIAKR